MSSSLRFGGRVIHHGMWLAHLGTVTCARSSPIIFFNCHSPRGSTSPRPQERKCARVQGQLRGAFGQGTASSSLPCGLHHREGQVCTICQGHPYPWPSGHGPALGQAEHSASKMGKLRHSHATQGTITGAERHWGCGPSPGGGGAQRAARKQVAALLCPVIWATWLLRGGRQEVGRA